jgi:hypothetical protein
MTQDPGTGSGARSTEHQSLAHATVECDCGAERYTWEQCPSCGRYGR